MHWAIIAIIVAAVVTAVVIAICVVSGSSSFKYNDVVADELLSTRLY